MSKSRVSWSYPTRPRTCGDKVANLYVREGVSDDRQRPRSNEVVHVTLTGGVVRTMNFYRATVASLAVGEPLPFTGEGDRP